MGSEKIEIPRGDTRVVSIGPLVDSDSVVIDLTNIDTIKFSVRKNVSDLNVLIGPLSGTVQGTPTAGNVAVTINATDTIGHNVGNFHYDVELTFLDSTVYTPIIDVFEIIAEMTP